MEHFNGYHGTDAKNVPSISENGFRASFSTSLRYGPGVYFFLDEITPCPKTDARNWVITNRNKDRTTTNYAIFFARVCVQKDQIWDMRSAPGLLLFNRGKATVLSRHAEKPPEAIEYLTSVLVMEAAEYKAVVGYMSIRTPLDNDWKLASCAVANTTVLCVAERGQNCIDAVEVVEEGPIEP